MDGGFRLRLGEIGQRDNEELVLRRGRRSCRGRQAGAGGYDVERVSRGSAMELFSERRSDRLAQHRVWTRDWPRVDIVALDDISFQPVNEYCP